MQREYICFQRKLDSGATHSHLAVFEDSPALAAVAYGRVLGVELEEELTVHCQHDGVEYGYVVYPEQHVEYQARRLSTSPICRNGDELAQNWGCELEDLPVKVRESMDTKLDILVVVRDGDISIWGPLGTPYHLQFPFALETLRLFLDYVIDKEDR